MFRGAPTVSLEGERMFERALTVVGVGVGVGVGIESMSEPPTTH
jgi:hypothetical protein